MHKKVILLFLLLASCAGVSEAQTTVSHFGIIQYKPDGTTQYSDFYSDSSICHGYQSGLNIHFTDGYLLGETTGVVEIFATAARAFLDRDLVERPRIDTKDLVFAPTEKEKLIVYIVTTDHRVKRFERPIGGTFASPDLQKLEAWLAWTLEK